MELDASSSSEVDTKSFFSTNRKSSKTDNHNDTGNDCCFLCCGEKVDVRGLDEVHEREFFQQVQIGTPAEKNAGDEDRREHGGDEAYGKCDGETFDTTARHRKEDDGGNERGDVCIEDGGEGFIVGYRDCGF